MNRKESEEEILSEVGTLWDNAQEFYSQQVNQWATNERLANSKHITARKAGRSSLFIPKIQGYIRRKQADYMSSFVKSSPITVKETITSTASGAKILQEVVNYYLDTHVDYGSFVYNAAQDALTYNFAPAYLEWETITDIQETSVMVIGKDGKPKEQKTKNQVTINEYPVITNIPPEDFRLDPSIAWNEIDDARYIAFRSFKDKAYALDKIDKGEWNKIDESYFTYSNTQALTDGSSLKAERSAAASPFSRDMSIEDDGIIEVRTHFLYEEQSNGDLVPVMVETLADNMVLSEPKPLPYAFGNKGKFRWPFVVGCIYPKAHEQYAPALPEQAMDLQLEVNAIRNQRRDNVALILNPEKMITPDSGIRPSAISFSYPGKVTTCNNPKGVVWQTPPDVTNAGHNEEKVAIFDMDRLFAEGPHRVGSPEVRKESATASQNMASGASAAANLDMKMFATSVLEPLISKLSILLLQAAPQEIFNQAAAKIGVQVPDAMLEVAKGEYIYSVFAGSMQSELNNEIGNASNIAGLIQTMYGPNANYRPLIESVLEAAGYDVNQVIPPTPQQQAGGMPDQSQNDMGGVMPQGTPSIQPRVQFQGGQFGAGTGKQG